MSSWQPSDLEFRSCDEIAAVQDELLRNHVAYIAANSPYYRSVFETLDIDPSMIRTVGDLARLPFTRKADLEAHNDDFLCVPEEQVVDVCQTSGTTGKPVALLQTQSDLDRVGYNERVSFEACGVTAADRIMIACALGRNFMAGMAYFLGTTQLGAMAIRTGSDSMPMIMDSIRRYRPSVLVAVPSMAAAMAKRFQAAGDDPRSFGVKRIICIGEPIRAEGLEPSSLGKALSELWGSQIYGTYASTEMATAFCDCEAQCGGHLHPDLIIVEVVDEDDKPVADGEAGEVVATPLGVTGMPLLRVRTGDVCRRHTETCACGRNSMRLGPVIGRKKQMLKIRGCTVYPPAIFNALQELPIEGSYMEVESDFDLSDRIKVVVGSLDDSLTAEAVAEHIAACARVKPKVEIKTPTEVREKTIVRDQRKPVRFFDLRNRS